MTVNTYRLIQQTPMIHFQSSEDGATLRASEVKPKLDRFILKQLERERKAVPDEWYVSAEHPALNYKLRFRAEGTPRISNDAETFIGSNRVSPQSAQRYTPKIHANYFGNMVDLRGANSVAEKSARVRAAFKETLQYDTVVMTVVCFNGALLTELDRYLPYFFALSAFGTRSSKGFGCFSVKGRAADDEALLKCCPLNIYYSVTYGKQSPNDLLNAIWVINGMMKGGFNFTFRNPNDYYKGHIFRYYTEKGVGGDKAFMKQRVLTRGSDTNPDSEERSRYTEFRFVRAMLGLPGGYEFKAGRNGEKTTRSGKVDVSSDDIARFQAPVHYRVQGDKLLIIPQSIPAEMEGARFSLNSGSIKTPEDFDLIDFLDSFVRRFNSKEDIKRFQSREVRIPLITNNMQIKKHGGDAS